MSAPALERRQRQAERDARIDEHHRARALAIVAARTAKKLAVDERRAVDELVASVDAKAFTKNRNRLLSIRGELAEAMAELQSARADRDRLSAALGIAGEQAPDIVAGYGAQAPTRMRDLSGEAQA